MARRRDLELPGCGQRQATAFAVGAYIAAAYWFTVCTSFANPAVTFAGIRPADVSGFIAAQVLGAASGDGAVRLARPGADRGASGRDHERCRCPYADAGMTPARTEPAGETKP